MRLSQHFGRTLRDAPADATLISHQLAMRAGLARPLAAGIWTTLPLGFRALRKIEQIIREEMNRTGAEEMRMPILQPAEVWQATGRWESVDVLVKLKNHEGRDFALAPTHEEVVVDLCLREIESYHDLPRAVYQFQVKERHEPRARGGLIRLREFLMKDAYSMHTDTGDLDRYYEACYAAYLRIFARCGLDAVPVEADTGMMGGKASHEFMLPHPQGEDRFVRCAGCGYTANIEAAQFRRGEAQTGEMAALEKVATPGASTIAELCAFLGIGPERTLKAVFYETPEGRLVMAMLRGDLDVNETKLAKAAGMAGLAAAREEAIRAAGAEPGYGSPYGLMVQAEEGGGGVIVLADESLEGMTNFVTGANEAGYHIVNANAPRDFTVTRYADLAEAFDGAACARCGGPLRIEQAIELGHCFKLGTRYSEPVGATYLDANSQQQFIVMGSYGIGLDRLLACIIERHHDEYGIVWPESVAPYAVHLVGLGPDGQAREAAEKLYADLLAAGVEALYDDRGLSPGVMFADADLMGMPLRATVSKRSLEAGGVEIKRRDEKERTVIPLEGAVERIAGMAASAGQRVR
jgi:prolyl-tRNA synthetase